MNDLNAEQRERFDVWVTRQDRIVNWDSLSPTEQMEMAWFACLTENAGLTATQPCQRCEELRKRVSELTDGLKNSRASILKKLEERDKERCEQLEKEAKMEELNCLMKGEV